MITLPWKPPVTLQYSPIFFFKLNLLRIIVWWSLCREKRNNNGSTNLGLTTRPYNNQQQQQQQQQQKKEKFQNCALCCLCRPHRVKLKKVKRSIGSPTFLGNWKKNPEDHVSDDYTSCNCCSWYSHRRIGKGTGGRGNSGTSGDDPNYSIIEIGQNTEKNPGDLRRLVPQTPVKNHQLTLMWKALKE